MKENVPECKAEYTSVNKHIIDIENEDIAAVAVCVCLRAAE